MEEALAEKKREVEAAQRGAAGDAGEMVADLQRQLQVMSMQAKESEETSVKAAGELKAMARENEEMRVKMEGMEKEMGELREQVGTSGGGGGGEVKAELEALKEKFKTLEEEHNDLLILLAENNEEDDGEGEGGEKEGAE